MVRLFRRLDARAPDPEPRHRLSPAVSPAGLTASPSRPRSRGPQRRGLRRRLSRIAIPALAASPTTTQPPPARPNPNPCPPPRPRTSSPSWTSARSAGAPRRRIASEYPPLGIPASPRLHQLLIHEGRSSTFADALRALSSLVAPPPRPAGAAGAVLRNDLAWVRRTSRTAPPAAWASRRRIAPSPHARRRAGDGSPRLHPGPPGDALPVARVARDVSLALASLFDVNFRDNWRRFCALNGAINSTYASTRADLVDVRNAVRETLARTARPRRAATSAARDVAELKERLGLKPPEPPARVAAPQRRRPRPRPSPTRIVD